MTLAAELRRLDIGDRYMSASAGDVADEAPLRVHSRDVDYGHDRSGGHPLRVHPPSFGHGPIVSGGEREHDGLGAPEFHPSFLAYLRENGVCMCPEPTEADQRAHRYPCSKAPTRIRTKVASHSNSRRWSRAFRQLRGIDPKAFDIMWPLHNGTPIPEVFSRINDGRYRRGENPYSEMEFAVHWLNGRKLLQDMF